MNDEQFMEIINKIKSYLATERKFTINPARHAQLETAVQLACNLFPDAKVYVENDPLQMGAMILCIEDYAIGARGETETSVFSDIIALADNFEIYAIDNETVKFTAVFHNVLV